MLATHKVLQYTHRCTGTQVHRHTGTQAQAQAEARRAASWKREAGVKQACCLLP